MPKVATTGVTTTTTSDPATADDLNDVLNQIFEIADGCDDTSSKKQLADALADIWDLSNPDPDSDDDDSDDDSDDESDDDDDEES